VSQNSSLKKYIFTRSVLRH